MIIATFRNDETKTYTKSAHQFDRGQRLIVAGIALPDAFEVHISNDQNDSVAYACTGYPEGTMIPDAFFVSGDFIYVWIYAIEKDDVDEGSVEEGTTAYEIIIPVIKRSVPGSFTQSGSGGALGYIVNDDHTLVPVRQ